MRTRRRSYTAAATPLSVFPEAFTVKPTDPVSGTRRRKLQSCATKAEENGGSKKNCIEGLWDVNIPAELLREILSRLGLKANIFASLVCKTWFQAAVSVRKLQSRPWIFYEAERSPDAGSSYILVDHPLRSKSNNIYKLDFPELKDFHVISCSRDGWVLMSNDKHVLFLNPFTKKRFDLPEWLTYYNGDCLAFSAAPTSSSCVVMECAHPPFSPFVISTWRPGETAWTIHRFEKPKRHRQWDKCVFSNGLFYCLSTRGYLGVFDPSKVTWNILPVKPCRNFNTSGYSKPVLLTEHEGDVFVMFTRNVNKPLVFRLNLKSNVWEVKRDLGGLTVFANNYASSLIIAGLSVDEKDRIYRSYIDSCTQLQYYSLVGGKSSRIIPWCIAWVESQQRQMLT